MLFSITFASFTAVVKSEGKISPEGWKDGNLLAMPFGIAAY